VPSRESVANVNTRAVAHANSPRYVELDSLRGLAALSVVLHHLRILWETDTQPTSPAFRTLLSLVSPIGSEAVILFFVLSGFVLSLPAIAGRPQNYRTFLTRRIFRIYVPYLAALAVSVAGAFWLHGPVTRSSWFHQSWSEPVHIRLVMQHVLFLGVFDTWQFDNPIWSLVQEMRISLIFPLLCASAMRTRMRSAIENALVLTILAVITYVSPLNRTPAVADTFLFAAFFVLGIALACERERVGAWLENRSRRAKILIGLGFVLLYLFAGPPLAGLSAPANPAGYLFLRAMTCLSQWVTALGAAGLLVTAMNSASAKRFLLWAPVHFLGKISYSIYLWHFIVLLYCVHLLYGKIPLGFILCLTLVLTIVVSWASYVWVEVPSMNFGRKLSNRFQRRPAIISA